MANKYQFQLMIVKVLKGYIRSMRLVSGEIQSAEKST